MRTKAEQMRESLNRLFTETENSEQTTRLLSRLTGEGLTIPERLRNLRERLEYLRTETEDISSLLEYHSGSRLSRVVDLLNQAEVLTEETIGLTTGTEVPNQA